MAEVDIGVDTYSAFADLDTADLYIAADATLAEPWSVLDDDGKGRNIVTATRILIRQPWKEAPSIDDPPAAVRDATCEFAGAIAAGYDLSTSPAASLQVRRQKAGSVEVEYFRNIDGPGYRPPPLPLAVWELIKPLLKSADSEGGLALSIASGTDGCSLADAGLGYDTPYVGFGPGTRDID